MIDFICQKCEHTVSEKKLPLDWIAGAVLVLGNSDRGLQRKELYFLCPQHSGQPIKRIKK